MRWADELTQHAKKAKVRKRKPVEAAPVQTGPPPAVHEFYITIRGASGNDPGQIAVGFYIVEHGQVVLTNADGKPLEDIKPEALPNGIDPRTIAVLMLRKRRQENDEDFNRELPTRIGGWR